MDNHKNNVRDLKETGAAKTEKRLVLTVLLNGMVVMESDRGDSDRMREILNGALDI